MKKAILSMTILGLLLSIPNLSKAEVVPPDGPRTPIKPCKPNN